MEICLSLLANHCVGILHFCVHGFVRIIQYKRLRHVRVVAYCHLILAICEERKFGMCKHSDDIQLSAHSVHLLHALHIRYHDTNYPLHLKK